MADFALLEYPKLISRKMWVIGKSWNFHNVRRTLLKIVSFKKIPLTYRKKELSSSRKYSGQITRHSSNPSWRRPSGLHSLRKYGFTLVLWSIILSRPSGYRLLPIWKSPSVLVDRSRNWGSKGNTTQCGNFRIFLSLRFYVKSILRTFEVQNQPF